MNQIRISVERWILESISQGVYALDKRGQLIYANHHCEKLFGWKASSVLGRQGLAVLVADIDRSVGSSILSYVFKGKVWSGLFRMKRVSGELMQTFMTASPILDVSGTVVAICATVVELEHLQPSSGDGVSSFASLKEAKWPSSPSTGDYPGTWLPPAQAVAAFASGIWQCLKSFWSRLAPKAVSAPPSPRSVEQPTDCGLGDSQQEQQEQAESLWEDARSHQRQKGRLNWESHKRQVTSTLANLKLPRAYHESNLSPESESGSVSTEPSPVALSPDSATYRYAQNTADR